MLRNYLITALRNLKRNRIYTLLNVFGLALGIGCALVIFKVIQFEYSFDKHQANYNQIYRVVTHNIYPDGVEKGMGTPHPVAAALSEDVPGIKHVCRINNQYEAQLNTYTDSGLMNKFLVEGVAFVDSTFFDVFTIDLIAGSRSNLLTAPKTMVISASEAKKVFGLDAENANLAIGKIINYGNVADFVVTGVMKDPPENTTFPFHYLIDYQSQNGEINPYYREGTSWNSTSSNTNTYFIPEVGFSIESFNKQMTGFVEKYHGEKESEKRNYLAQPLSDIHFNKEYDAYVNTTSRDFMLALAIIGIFLVITACINFINLATAQATNRAKEIGIRKAIGSMSRDLVIQFMSEIALITLTSLVIALVIAEVMFHRLHEIIGHHLSIDLFNGSETGLFILALFFLVTFLSGFYPAVLLSRMNAVDALKKKITSQKHSGGLSLRKGLVTFQFAISQFLIIGTLIVSSQMDFFLNKDLGFDKEAILTSYLPERDPVKIERFRKMMMESPAISGVTFSLGEPTSNSNSSSNFNYAPLQSEDSYNGNFKPVDESFDDLFGLELLAGRFIEKGDSNNVVINRKIADLIGFKDQYADAIGETLTTGWNGDKKIVGVMENFHAYSLDEDLDYVLLLYFPEAYYNIAFKTPSLASVEDAKAVFESTWNTVFPKYVLDYEFYDQKLARNYEDVQHIMGLMRIFAIIAILIGCLGLYGLIAFIAMNKTKEIGIRKVLGASIYQILGIFSKEISTLLLVAFVITAPLAFFLLREWLDTFAYRIDIGIWFFVVGFFITLLIALITISHKTISTALINPAKTLHDD